MDEQIAKIRAVLEMLNASFPTEQVSEALAALKDLEEHVDGLSKMWEEYSDYMSIR